MLFQGKNIFNASFDVFADDYHSVRPSYPEVLFKDVKDECGIDDQSRLLEIGAGSGIATAELAKFGSYISAIEPGAHLAVIARKQTENFKNVYVHEGTFENFQTDDSFDAILAFTAFHWLSEGDKYKRVFDLLNDSGNLVLVWNSFFQSDSEASIEINEAYQDFFPDVYPELSKPADVNEGVLSKLSRREQKIFANPLFSLVFLRKYLTVYNYDGETYPKLLNTFPKIVKIEEKKRLQFFERISEIVKRHGEISVPVLTTLIILRKRDHFVKSLSNLKGGL